MSNKTFYILLLSAFCSGAALAMAFTTHYINRGTVEIIYLKQMHKLEKEELQIELNAYQKALRATNQDCKE